MILSKSTFSGIFVVLVVLLVFDFKLRCDGTRLPQM